MLEKMPKKRMKEHKDCIIYCRPGLFFGEYGIRPCSHIFFSLLWISSKKNCKTINMFPREIIITFLFLHFPAEFLLFTVICEAFEQVFRVYWCVWWNMPVGERVTNRKSAAQSSPLIVVALYELLTIQRCSSMRFEF